MTPTRAVLIGLVLLAGCSGSSPSAPTTTTPAPVLYEGNWSGKTAQAQDITFAVSGNSILSLNFRYVFAPTVPGCGGAGGEMFTIGPVVSGTITQGRFVITSTGPAQTTTLTGTFDSWASVSGTLSVVITGPAPGATVDCRSPIDTTWTAAKGS